MPITAIRNSVLTAPSTPPIARVTMPTPLSSWPARPCTSPGSMAKPWLSSQAISRSACSVTISGSCAASREICEPANWPSQTKNSTASSEDDAEPPAAPDLEHAAEQPRAAVEHRGEHHRPEDHQQRLRDVDRQDRQADDQRPRPARAWPRSAAPGLAITVGLARLSSGSAGPRGLLVDLSVRHSPARSP